MKIKKLFVLCFILVFMGCSSTLSKKEVNTVKETAEGENFEKGISDIAEKIVINISKRDKNKIAVSVFQNIEGTEGNLGKYVADEITEKLSKRKEINLVERIYINKVLEEEKLKAAGIVDEDTAKKMGKISGADIICAGTITDLGKTIKLNIRLLSCESGSVIFSEGIKIAKNREIERLAEGKGEKYIEYYENGMAYNKLKEYEKAVGEFSKAIELNSGYSPAYHNRGVAYMMQKKYAEAVNDFSKTIEIDPKNLKPYYNRGMIYLRTGDNYNSVKDFTAVININPNYYNAYYFRGKGNRNINEKREAVSDFQKFIECRPGDEKVKRAKEIMENLKSDNSLALDKEETDADSID